MQGEKQALLSVASIEGILTAVAMGLLFGYIFRRPRNIVAPWLAHALWIVALILVGGLTFVRFTP